LTFQCIIIIFLFLLLLLLLLLLSHLLTAFLDEQGLC